MKAFHNFKQQEFHSVTFRFLFLFCHKLIDFCLNQKPCARSCCFPWLQHKQLLLPFPGMGERQPNHIFRSSRTFTWNSLGGARKPNPPFALFWIKQWHWPKKKGEQEIEIALTLKLGFNRTIESLRMKKTSKVINSSFGLNTTMSTWFLNNSWFRWNWQNVSIQQ